MMLQSYQQHSKTRVNCTDPEHSTDEITAICKLPNCNQPSRLACIRCITEGSHQVHAKDMIKIKQILKHDQSVQSKLSDDAQINEITSQIQAKSKNLPTFDPFSNPEDTLNGDQRIIDYMFKEFFMTLSQSVDDFRATIMQMASKDSDSSSSVVNAYTVKFNDIYNITELVNPLEELTSGMISPSDCSRQIHLFFSKKRAAGNKELKEIYANHLQAERASGAFQKAKLDEFFKRVLQEMEKVKSAEVSKHFFTVAPPAGGSKKSSTVMQSTQKQSVVAPKKEKSKPVDVPKPRVDEMLQDNLELEDLIKKFGTGSQQPEPSPKSKGAPMQFKQLFSHETAPTSTVTPILNPILPPSLTGQYPASTYPDMFSQTTTNSYPITTQPTPNLPINTQNNFGFGQTTTAAPPMPSTNNWSAPQIPQQQAPTMPAISTNWQPSPPQQSPSMNWGQSQSQPQQQQQQQAPPSMNWGQQQQQQQPTIPQMPAISTNWQPPQPQQAPPSMNWGQQPQQQAPSMAWAQQTNPFGLSGRSKPGYELVVAKEVRTFHAQPICGFALIDINAHLQSYMTTKHGLHTLGNTILVTVSFDKALTTYDFASGERLYSAQDIHGPNMMTCMKKIETTQFELTKLMPSIKAFENPLTCPTHLVLTACMEGAIKAFDVTNGVCLKTQPAPPKGYLPSGKAGGINNIVCGDRIISSPAGTFLVRLLFASFEDNTIRIFNFLNGNQLLEIRDSDCIAAMDSTAIMLSSCGMAQQSQSMFNNQFIGQSSLVPAGGNQIGGPMQQQSNEEKPVTIVFTGGNGAQVRMWETMKGTLVGLLPTGCRNIAALKLLDRTTSEVGNLRDKKQRGLLAIGEMTGPHQPAKIELWNFMSKNLVMSFLEHDTCIDSLTFMTRSEDIYIVSGASNSSDKRLKMWEVATGMKVQDVPIEVGYAPRHQLDTATIELIDKNRELVIGGLVRQNNDKVVVFFSTKVVR